MKCLIKYKWIKLPRDLDVDAKGLMTYYIRLDGAIVYPGGAYAVYNYREEMLKWMGVSGGCFGSVRPF